MRSVLITGAGGGIGVVLCREFTQAGYRVIATDIMANAPKLMCDVYISIDLDEMCRDAVIRDEAMAAIRSAVENGKLAAIVNNAALQVVKPVEALTADDWAATFNVNMIAPFLLVQSLLPELEAENGCVLNISSIHAKLTKPGFVAYATSKAALSGLTRSMAVELGGKIRVNAIEPAAVITDMLRAGFANDPGKIETLSSYHPSKCLGTPEEIAEVVLFLVRTNSRFLNGAIIDISGGIHARLNDPG
jgi:NAD(P)-dependent dehydrogenase (short-subunit alcohol dehydrogenase family)